MISVNKISTSVLPKVMPVKLNSKDGQLVKNLVGIRDNIAVTRKIYPTGAHKTSFFAVSDDGSFVWLRDKYISPKMFIENERKYIQSSFTESKLKDSINKQVSKTSYSDEDGALTHKIVSTKYKYFLTSPSQPIDYYFETVLNPNIRTKDSTFKRYDYTTGTYYKTLTDLEGKRGSSFEIGSFHLNDGKIVCNKTRRVIHNKNLDY